ncbi:MAG: HAMP domain-containing sensor histidine kinase, partial [Patescibacteria group bacterium]
IKKDAQKENNELYYKELTNSLESLIDLTNLFTNMSMEDFSPQTNKLNSDDLAKALNEILERSGRLLKEKNITFEFNLPAHFPIIVSDFFTFKTAMAVLLDNAMRYTRSGGQVSLIVKQDGNKLLVSVKDNGVGIPNAEQYKIFSKFYRASNAAAAEPNGSGVALYYIRSLIERYGGAISFQSELGKGTIFNCIFKTI